jgi:hypothetical protein
MKVTDLRRKLMAALAAGGLLAPSAVAHAAGLNTNLLVNPGFENVDTSITGGYNGPKILDWSSTGGLSAFAYAHTGAGGQGADYANGRPLGTGGKYYFSADNNKVGANDVNITAAGQYFQDIDVSTGASSSLIATGTAAYKISGFFSGYLTQPDKGTIQVNFLNGSGTSIGTASVTSTDPSTWNQYFAGGLIPVGTATARLSIFGAPGFTGGPSAYIDNVDFEVSDQLIQPALAVSVNRGTGAMTLANQTGASVNIKSYSITSGFEGLEPANWRSIADNYDAGNPGPNQVDAAHNWSKLTNPTANGDLSEADLQAAVGASLAHTRTVSIGNAGAWIQNPNEDLIFQYISGNQVVQGVVVYTGNGGVPFAVGDLNVDGVVNAADWVIFRTNQQTDLSSKSLAEAYRLGDLSGDRLNDHADFVLFKSAYDIANGAGAFVTMIGSVPEPSTVVLVLSAGLISIPFRRRAAGRD